MEQIDYDIDDFMNYCEVKNLSKKTIASYEQTLRLFALYLKKEHKVKEAGEVKEIHIREYIKYLQERGKYTVIVNENTKKTNNPENRTDYKGVVTGITINNYMRNIKVFFNYMFSEKLIRTNPVEGLKKLKARRKPKYYIKDEELIRLLNN